MSFFQSAIQKVKVLTQTFFTSSLHMNASNPGVDWLYSWVTQYFWLVASVLKRELNTNYLGKIHHLCKDASEASRVLYNCALKIGRYDEDSARRLTFSEDRRQKEYQGTTLFFFIRIKSIRILRLKIAKI